MIKAISFIVLNKLKESFGLDQDLDVDESDDERIPPINKKNVINQFYPDNAGDNVSGNIL